jgi:hypothetical protein
MQDVVPFGIKISYYAFMALMVPTYIAHYPLINFLNLCHVHLFLVLASFLTDKYLFVSMSAVGILVILFLWCFDFICETMGTKFLGNTAYMYDEKRSLYMRSFSLFHVWFPFLLLYLIKKVGYDQRALYRELLLAKSICILSYYQVDLYNKNVNLMKDLGIFGLFLLCPITMFLTHYFLLWWDCTKKIQ